MIIGSTSYRTFADLDDNLHEALQNCSRAKIMLFDPFKEWTSTRTRGIQNQKATSDMIRERIIKNIEFLKKLRTARKEVRLKLYPDLPIMKLVIIGNDAFFQHYRTGMNMCQTEHAFRNASKRSGLYISLYWYFLTRWQDITIPEYDFDSDELVYCDLMGNEVVRARFCGTVRPSITDEDLFYPPMMVQDKNQVALT